MANKYGILVQLQRTATAALCSTLLSLTPTKGASFSAVAVTGQQAPGAEAGVLYDNFINLGPLPHLNAAGQVMFSASLTGTNVNSDNDGGLWITEPTSSNTILLGRQGAQAPGVPAGISFGADAFVKTPPFMGTSNTNNLNNAGQFLYWAELVGEEVDDSNNAALWTGTSVTDTTLVARTGDQAVGFEDGVVYSHLLRGTPVINANGQFAFSGQVSGAGITHLRNDDAVWTGMSSNLDLFLQAGDAAPDTTENFISHYSNGFGTLLDDDGDMQIWSWLTTSGFPILREQGIWSGDSAASLALLARSGDPAPGLGSDVVLSAPFLRSTTDEGKSVFTSTLSGTGVTSANSGTVWLDDPINGLELLARRGDPSLPGSGGNLTFEVFTGTDLNESGTFLFTTQWDHVSTGSPAVAGIHIGTSAADLTLLVGGDQPIPGLDAAWRISSIGASINNVGQVVFHGHIKESALATSFVGEGIWGYDPEGGVELLVQRGDLLKVAPDDWRIVQQLVLPGGSSLADGTRRGLADNGEFVFVAEFTDGSEGIFVGGLGTPVPEPSAIALATMATLLMMRRRALSKTNGT